jgi:recombinational DNA repair protein RecT
MDIKEKDAVEKAKADNQRSKEKIRQFRIIIECLKIRKNHFDNLSKKAIIPRFMRAKYKIQSVEIQTEITSKEEFIQAYQERIVNTKYLEKVVQAESQKD